MVSIGSGAGKARAASSVRAQAAVEYLATYGWALVVIVGIITLLFVLGQATYTVAPTTCAFNSGVYCNQVLFGSNTAGSSVILLVSNAQQYPVAASNFIINTQNQGNVTGTCAPAFVIPGGSMICTAQISAAYGAGSLVSSSVFIKEKTCVTGRNIATCGGGSAQVLSGVVNAHVQIVQSQTPITITLSVLNSTQAINGAQDLLTATVKLFGAPYQGAAVNFTSYPTFPTIYPPSATTDLNGRVVSYISSQTTGNVIVYANFSGYSVNVPVAFIYPFTVTFAIANTFGATGNALIINGTTYTTSQIPLTIRISQSNRLTYSYANVIYGSGFFISNVVASGCGASGATAVVTVVYNCTVTATYSSANVLSIGAPSASPGTIPQGQSSSITDSGAIGGVSPYAYQWLATAVGGNSFTAAQGNSLCGSSSDTLSCGFGTTGSTTAGTYMFELRATDSEGTPKNVISSAANVMVNAVPACPNNYAGNSLGGCIGNIVYSSSTTLNGDVNAIGSVTVDGGVTLTTNGYSIFLSGAFTNSGTVTGGTISNTGGGAGNGGGSATSSYAGSGGAGGGTAVTYDGGSGGSTIASGGTGGSFGGSGGSGASPSAPTVSNANIASWYSSGFAQYLESAGGGGGASANGQGGSGASAVYGVYIQANQITAGTINVGGATGSSGGSYGGSCGHICGPGGGGGGSGGAIALLAYGPGGYTSGTYTTSGGSGGSPGSGGGNTGTNGGSGGNGNVVTYNYATPPLTP